MTGQFTHDYTCYLKDPGVIVPSGPTLSAAELALKAENDAITGTCTGKSMNNGQCAIRAGWTDPKDVAQPIDGGVNNIINAQAFVASPSSGQANYRCEKPEGGTRPTCGTGLCCGTSSPTESTFDVKSVETC